MQNIGLAFLAIAEMAHDWADVIASEQGVDYDAYCAAYGQDNEYFADALYEMDCQSGDAWRVHIGEL